VSIRSARQGVQLVVSGFYEGGEVRDLTRAADFVPDVAGVVEIRGSRVEPLQSGQVAVVVRAGDREARARVTVLPGAVEPHPPSFLFEVLPVLSKQDCSSGECHGSPHGKGGFRLSLRAFRPAADIDTLVNEHRGRRANPAAPEASLVLRKPTLELPHQGGRRLRRGDFSWRVLRDWIAQRCPVDVETAPRCVGVDIYPPSGRVLERPAHTQQLRVQARFDDGTARDVTSLAVFTSSDERVAGVTPDGLVVGHDRGETAVVVRYLEFIESVYLTFVKDVPDFAWSEPAPTNYIDARVAEKLQQLKFVPADRCTDGEFLRRVRLDLVGTLPDPAATLHFLSDSSPDKRDRLIDRLLESPEYAKFWTLKWGDLLRLSERQVGKAGARKYHRWIEQAVASNMPYDRFSLALLTASGSTFLNPPANYFRTTADANDAMETSAQIFLGTRIQCAKCHNHPFERWTQDNYYGLVSFFSAVRKKHTGRPGEQLVWTEPGEETIHPHTGQPAQPWLPGRGDVDLSGADDPREEFARWLAEKENPFFARVEVNRIWAHLFGRGIVEPFDDFRDSNPPSNAPLLEALARDFVEHGFDREHILRTILRSRTYQRSARAGPLNREDRMYFSRYLPRRLSAEQMLDAVGHVLGLHETFPAVVPTTRATQLPVPDLAKSNFLKVFGQPQRESVCACERVDESSLPQTLELYNGATIHSKLTNPENRFHAAVARGEELSATIDELYLVAYCRAPSPRERAAALGYVAASSEPSRALEDVCWAVLNQTEFLFQH